MKKNNFIFLKNPIQGYTYNINILYINEIYIT